MGVEKHGVHTLFPTLWSLRTCPRELFLIFFLKYLESYAYFVFSYNLILFLSDEFGFTDEEAGMAYGVYNMLISVYGFFVGVLIDHMGVKWSLVLGSSVLCISRVALTFASSVHVLILVLFTTLPLGGALGIPVMQIGIKRWTDDTNRTVAFSAFYMIMNMAAITAAPTIDLFHRTFPYGIMLSGHHISAYRMLFLSGACMTFISAMCGLIFVRDTPTTKEKKSEGFVETYRHVLASKPFWRFLLLICLLIGVRVIFRHLDATFPKYMVREFGPEALYGSVIAINPCCVMICVPLLTPIAMYVKPLTMIIVGATVSSVAPLLLTLGHSYFTAVSFVLILSIGESIWSPRLYEYTVQVAEEGREGTYMALASTPMFFATFFTGAMSGFLLDHLCPATGVRHAEMMWGIIAICAIISSTCLIILRRFIEGPEELPVSQARE